MLIGSGACSIPATILIVSLTLSVVSPHPFSNPHSLSLDDHKILAMQSVNFKILNNCVLIPRIVSADSFTTFAQNSGKACLLEGRKGKHQQVIMLPGTWQLY